MFEISPRFCILPFLHHHVNPQGEMTPCCMNKDVMGNVFEESMETIFSGEGFRKIRETFLNGGFPESCANCKHLEDQKIPSMRQGVNLRFKKDVISLGLMTDPSGRLPYYKPKSLDIRFSNLCNLKCRSCGPGCSSSWAKEEGQEILSTIPSTMLEEVQKLIPQIEEIYFAGGEPLLMRENLTVIKDIIKTNPNTRVTYNTNLSSLAYHGVDYLDLWKGLNDLLIIVSLDDLGAKGEYLRSGMNFKKFMENAKKLQEAGVDLRFNTVVSAINAFSLKEMSEFFAKEFPDAITEFTLLITPTHLRISVLPEEIRTELSSYLKSLREKTCNEDLKSFIKLALGELEEDYSHYCEQLVNSIRLIDARRGESFLEVYATHPLKTYF